MDSMTRIEEAEDVVYRTLSGKYGDFGHQEEVVRALDADGHLLPDLPEPDNTYPEWKIGNQSIVKGIHPGAVGLEWEDREDTGRGTVTRTLYLTSEQVQAIIAAHYHREDKE